MAQKVSNIARRLSEPTEKTEATEPSNVFTQSTSMLDDDRLEQAVYSNWTQ